MDRLAAALGGAGVLAAPEGALMEAEHTFSHIHWNMRVFRFQQVNGRGGELTAVAESASAYEADDNVNGLSPDPDRAEYRWITKKDMGELAFPNVFIRILNQYFSTR